MPKQEMRIREIRSIRGIRDRKGGLRAPASLFAGRISAFGV